MGATPPYGTFQAVYYRLAKITSAGAPVPGANNGYAGRALISATVDPDIQAGTEDTLKRGDGEICATSKEDDIVKRVKVELNLCNLDAAAISMLTGAVLYSSGGVPMGYQILGPDDSTPAGVILELWSKAWDVSVQATPSALSSAAAYWHWVFPRTKGQLAKQTLDSKHNVVPFAGTSDTNDHATQNGPYDDWPAYVSTGGGVTEPYGVFLDVAPAFTEGYLTVTSAAS